MGPPKAERRCKEPQDGIGYSRWRVKQPNGRKFPISLILARHSDEMNLTAFFEATSCKFTPPPSYIHSYHFQHQHLLGRTAVNDQIDQTLCQLSTLILLQWTLK